MALQIRQGKDTLSADTIKKYEAALEIRDTTIKDLNSKIRQSDDLHVSQITSLQTQITNLQSQITALNTEKKALEDTVTGKAYLEKIVSDLADIKIKLGITNRHEDAEKPSGSN